MSDTITVSAQELKEATQALSKILGAMAESQLRQDETLMQLLKLQNKQADVLTYLAAKISALESRQGSFLLRWFRRPVRPSPSA